MIGRFTKIRLTERVSVRSKCDTYSWVIPAGSTFECIAKDGWFETRIEGKAVGFNMLSTFVEEIGPIESLADLA